MSIDMPSPEIPLHPNDPAFAWDHPWARRAFRYPELSDKARDFIAGLRTSPGGESDAEKIKRLEAEVVRLSKAQREGVTDLVARLTPLVDSLVGLLAPDQGSGLTREERVLFAVASAIQARLGDPEPDPASAPEIARDGQHRINPHRAWLARQLYDSSLSDEDAYGIVAYHPSISDQYGKEDERDV